MLTKLNTELPADSQMELARMFEAGEFAVLEARVRCLIDEYPRSGFAWKVLGATLQEQGKEAVDALRTAVALSPGDPDGLSNLGNELTRLGILSDAVDVLKRAVALAPKHPQAHNNLGNVLTRLGNFSEAVSSFRIALELAPNYAEAHCNLGVVWVELGETEKAKACLLQALSLKPHYAEAHNALGVALQRQGLIDESIESYRRALACAPNHSRAHNNLGTALKSLDRLEDALSCYQRALEISPDFLEAYSNLLYLHAFTRDISPEAERRLAEKWERSALSDEQRRVARVVQSTSTHGSRRGRKLKIGVMSAELGQHAVSEFLIPFLERIDRSRFHLTLYSTMTRQGPRVELLRNLADDFQSLVGTSDIDAAALIRTDHIDVLIDTTAHLYGSRLGVIAHRAAPVQCHYIGYHGTTGISEMDWFIGDETLLPPTLNNHFTERIWRLPRLWIAYKGDASLPVSGWKPRSDGSIWLGSFNNLAKVREDTLSLWASVLNAIPQALLFLKDRNAISLSVQSRVTSSLTRFGVSAERVVFAGHTSDWQSHMTMYDQIDIALDPIPLNSGTTAFDALWMGVPLVSIEGSWMGARMSSAILRAFGKPEWVTQSEEEYVAVVASLASNVPERVAQRAVQRDQMAASQLCDGVGLTRALETAFERMFDEFCELRTGRPEAHADNQGPIVGRLS